MCFKGQRSFIRYIDIRHVEQCILLPVVLLALETLEEHGHTECPALKRHCVVLNEVSTTGIW